uniref:Uncharacterized protein n=1 Tax=Hanusia phi TaxID=3032 RepID=A0A7S0DW36_9CRYP|eukprot:441905-Hanusia_phi.AAC.7
MTAPTNMKRQRDELLLWQPEMGLNDEEDCSKRAKFSACTRTSLLFRQLRNEVLLSMEEIHRRDKVERQCSREIAERNPLTFPGSETSSPAHPGTPEHDTHDTISNSKLTPALQPRPVQTPDTVLKNCVDKCMKGSDTCASMGMESRPMHDIPEITI